jgi:type I restriction enzyme S subunit
MGSEWREVPIGELGRVAIGPFGSRMKADLYVDSGVPVLRGSNIGDSPSLTGDFVFVSDQTADGLPSANAFSQELIFPHRGAIGRVGIVPADGHRRYMLGTSLMKLTCDRDLLDPLYAFYWFRSPNGQAELLKNSSTVGTPGIGQPLATLKRIRIPLPPLAEQHRIGSILGALDDKIELNRRMSQTLESMARALFKSWFVDFDPVRAKFEGRDTGLPQKVADLFPDSFDDSELGEVPAGWRVAAFGDVATSQRRPVQPNDIDPATPYIGLEHMPRSSIALAEWGEVGSVDSGKTSFRRGEILFGKLRPYFHKVGVAPTDGVCSTDIVVVGPRVDAWFGFVLAHISTDEFVDYTNASSTGTRMPRTSWSDMARYPLVLPPADIAAAFTDLVAPAVDRMVSSTHQTRTLAKLRDLLLPKLISGEVGIYDPVAARRDA